MTEAEMKALKPGDRVNWLGLQWIVTMILQTRVVMQAAHRGGSLPYSAHDELTKLNEAKS